MTYKRIVIGCDHVGVEFLQGLSDSLPENIRVVSRVIPGDGTKVHYPHIAFRLTQHILDRSCEYGLLVCGTGIGMSIAANKVAGIRAACCSDRYSAKMSRLHNDANVLCLGARVIGLENAADILKEWFSTEYEGGRHQHRINLIKDYEESR